jgi:thiosulfate/3-mercaptopyruvate sulfurtransferase
MPSDKKIERSTALSFGIFFSLIISFLMVVCSHSLWAFDLQRIETPQAATKLRQMIVLDARPVTKWREGHIPGAMSFSWEEYTRTDADGVKYRISPPEELAEALGSMGVSNSDAVLVYGDADSSWGGEGWLAWMLAWLGHRGCVYFLDGGIQSWEESGQPIHSDSSSKRPKTTYQVNLQQQVNISSEQLEAQQDHINLIDTRGYLTEWLPGHLPGAIHIPWEKFYQGLYRKTLSADALRSLLQKNGVDLKKPVVYYCSGGIRSGYAWLVHQLSGLPSAINFEGGTEKWARKRPLAGGAEADEDK